MNKEKQIPLNIWNNIERCWIMRLDLVMEGQTIVGIHHSDFVDIISDVDWLCKKLQQYKSEMQCLYENKTPETRSMLKTYVYILLDKQTGYYKVGRSINPRFREKTLQAEKPDYEMIWISPLTYSVCEKEIHKHFASKRVRGEWFKLDENDINHIQNIDYGS